jgi:hypothetical protein
VEAEITEPPEPPPDTQAELEEPAEPGRRRPGRPMIPEQWSRVVSASFDDADRVPTHVLATDLMLHDSFQAPPIEDAEKPWAPIFFPRSYV